MNLPRLATMNRSNALSILGASSLLLLLGTASCKQQERAADVGRQDNTRSSDSAVATTPMPSGLDDTTELKATLDTTAPTPLAQAPADLAADVIPLRAPDGGITRYGIRSGRVVMKFTGNSRGTRTMTFNDYGMHERKEERTIPYPPGQSKGAINNLIYITTAEYGAYADMRTKMGWRRKNEGVNRYLASQDAKSLSFADYAVKLSGAERLPDTTIAGYHCKVLRKSVGGMTVTNWIWRGILIREQLISKADNYEATVEPVEITPNIDVPASTFEFPAGYKISEYGSPQGK